MLKRLPMPPAACHSVHSAQRNGTLHATAACLGADRPSPLATTEGDSMCKFMKRTTTGRLEEAANNFGSEACELSPKFCALVQ